MIRGVVFLFLLLVGLIVAILFVGPLFERHPPTISIKLDSQYLGTRPFEVEIKDTGRGLKESSVTLVAAGKEYMALREDYTSPLMEKQITAVLSAQAGIPEGPATLRVVARDRSYWGFFRGNETVLVKEVTVNLKPPALGLVAGDQFISFGGSGIILYSVSPGVERSGVKIGRYFFPGYRQESAENTHLAFFAHPYDVPKEEKAVLLAEDKAGNVREIPLSYTLRDVRYRKYSINVTDDFIKTNMLPLLSKDLPAQSSLKDVFLKVNREMRQENEAKIREVCQKSGGKRLWTASFHQLSNSQVQANFADERTYVYGGEAIDQAYHLGYDLAVTKNYPVEAANNGVVVFTADLGIYGNTVILDHGLGLFTMYSHMSSITVNKGDEVKRKQVIGKTGETGLATGDHLHYATLIHGVPVLPLEWWDGKWVKDNVLDKMEGSVG